jgi:hypothetical protein
MWYVVDLAIPVLTLTSVSRIGAPVSRNAEKTSRAFPIERGSR